TADYVTGTAAIDSDTYYYLNSGYKIPYSRRDNSASGKVTVTHIKVHDGYIMPSNSVNIVSCETVNGNTKIKLDMNRKVPFNARLTGQTYTDNGFGRKYKVSSPDFTGIEFTFYDTVSITGPLDFGSAMLSKGRTSVSGDQAKLSISFTNKGRFYGWHCEYDSQGCLIITIKKKPASISDYTIMIDAGHGGVDSGAACAVSSGSWNEKKLTLSIASKIKAILENEGAHVIMTRSDDGYLSLASRTAMIRRFHPDLFISVHCDAAGTSSAYGTTAYYYRAFSQPLAKYVHESIVSAYKNSIYAGMNRKGTDRGALYGCYRVTRVEECPSILVEYGFLTEATECRALQNSTNRDILAKATVSGIKKYIANS
ncbi:MAG: N-acetylmuramoyl-L-alanine amidase, partial [Clostridia bacterium]|nr:N-acetylmuramoyl-L-alanine amidase [Clostridia bacterium]